MTFSCYDWNFALILILNIPVSAFSNRLIVVVYIVFTQGDTVFLWFVVIVIPQISLGKFGEGP